MMLTVGLPYIAFIILKYVASRPTLFWEAFFCLFVCFTINECWILLCLSFILLMCYIMLVDFWILNHPYIPGINPTWSWYMVLLMHCYIQFANILLRIIASMFIWDIRLEFSSFVVSLFGFGTTLRQTL